MIAPNDALKLDVILINEYLKVHFLDVCGKTDAMETPIDDNGDDVGLDFRSHEKHIVERLAVGGGPR